LRHPSWRGQRRPAGRNHHGSGRLLHHSIGTTHHTYQRDIASRLTCAAVSIVQPEQAPELIDHAIRTALREKKPAYIEIACNLSQARCAAPGPISGLFTRPGSDEETLDDAVEATLELLEQAA
jgi:pyruvate decarboxylase